MPKIFHVIWSEEYVYEAINLEEKYSLDTGIIAQCLWYVMHILLSDVDKQMHVYFQSYYSIQDDTHILRDWSCKSDSSNP